jgi:hypothetical protein
MSDDIGYGNMGVRETASDQNVIAFAIAAILSRMCTVRIVRVQAVHANDGDEPQSPGTVDVLPLVNMLDGNGNSTQHGTVHGMPWVRLQGGTSAVVADPKVDDIGLALISDRDISNVKSTKDQADPGSRRTFDLADGLYLGALFGAIPENFLLFKSAGGFKLVDKFGNVIESTDQGFELTPASGGAFLMNGDGKFTGEVYAFWGSGFQVGASTHSHTQPNDSHGDVEAPTAMPTPGT